MADKTTLQESTQALFCSLADYSGLTNVRKIFDINKYPTYGMFKNFWLSSENPVKGLTITEAFKSRVDAPQITGIKQIEDFLIKNNDWYISSVLIAKKLVEDIDEISRDFQSIKRPKWSDIFYVRGDDVVMKNIAELFKIANDTQKKINAVKGSDRAVIFGDINKWSPADIYLASSDVKTKIQKTLVEAKKTKSFSFNSLNALVSESIEEGGLLPLSLKKTTKEVKIVKVNFNRTSESKELKKYFYNGVSPWKKYSIKSPQTRDLKIYFTADKRDHLKIRHDASSASFKAEFQLANSEARGGSIGSVSIFVDIISMVDASFGKKFEKFYEDGNKKYKSEVAKLGEKPKTEKQKKAYDAARGELSAIYVTNNIIPPLIEWLNRPTAKNKSDEFVRLLFQYITSRTIKSSKFVIAK